MDQLVRHHPAYAFLPQSKGGFFHAFRRDYTIRVSHYKSVMACLFKADRYSTTLIPRLTIRKDSLKQFPTRVMLPVPIAHPMPN
jgi:hypothetical protein